MPRISAFDSATIVDGGKVRVTGPAGGSGAMPQPPTPVHFAIVQGNHLLRGTGWWTDAEHWSGLTDEGNPHLAPGEADAYALEVQFFNDHRSGGFQTYAWSQSIALEQA